MTQHKKYLFPLFRKPGQSDPISLVQYLFSKIPQKFYIVPSEIYDLITLVPRDIISPGLLV